MNAGANNINEAGIALVYLANVLPSLLMKITGPYWFHYVSYRCRIRTLAVLMVITLVTVAWGRDPHVKLLGVAICSLASGVGEASMLAMASFYDPKPCLAAWSSGTGFAGIAGYVWSLAFDGMDLCFQVQLMVALWIPIAWLLTFFKLLGPPWIDKERQTADAALEECQAVGAGESPSSDDSESAISEGSASTEHSESEVATGKLTSKERFTFILSLWPYTLPLFVVYAAEYTIQSGFWAAMGFPVTNHTSRVHWYKWSNFTYQVGVFISRSLFVLICKSRKILWTGAGLQIVMAVFFGLAATKPFGNWWLLAPAFVTGLLGGGVYVGAFSLIAQEQHPAYVELALSSASVADTFGMILANVLGLIAQGCIFGQMQITDTKPDFTCGYNIWDSFNGTQAAPTYAGHCFPGVKG
ncbi:unnamed protein product [Effrenium voratum]|nr:unnamed protein product [Effrenium voratum]